MALYSFLVISLAGLKSCVMFLRERRGCQHSSKVLISWEIWNNSCHLSSTTKSSKAMTAWEPLGSFTPLTCIFHVVHIHTFLGWRNSTLILLFIPAPLQSAANQDSDSIQAKHAPPLIDKVEKA
ncbi:hypothetical protein KC368_g79 [Hortaea werneckii]|nr:hypothetical protein KC368_g79 [Hortaea werneckii]